MPHQMHEAAHRVVFGRVVRNAGRVEHVADLLVRADPDREHRFGRTVLCRDICATTDAHGIRDRVGRSDRGLHVHHQHRVIAGVGQQHLERRRIARRVGVADDVDRIGLDQVGGSTASSLARVSGEISARVPPSSTSRSTARTPMPPPLVRIASRLPGRLRRAPASRRSRTAREIEHPQHPGAAKRGVIDRVRSRRARRYGSRRPLRPGRGGPT